MKAIRAFVSEGVQYRSPVPARSARVAPTVVLCRQFIDGSARGRLGRRGQTRRPSTGYRDATEAHSCNFDTMKPELVSQRIRLAVREEFVGWTLAQIGDLFTAEGFSPDLSYSTAGRR
jgi:hypothetical protein